MTYEFFPDREFEDCNPPCKPNDMDPVFMAMLIELRQAYGGPIRLTCAYRSPAHEAHMKRSGLSAHTEGVAVDVAVAGWDSVELICLAKMMGFTGIGNNQVGPYSTRFVHLDTADEIPGRPRPHFWGY